jgi:hypothetical protein
MTTVSTSNHLSTIKSHWLGLVITTRDSTLDYKETNMPVLHLNCVQNTREDEQGTIKGVPAVLGQLACPC